MQEGLLQELNHRVRNSLQLVIGVLAMEESDAQPECRMAIAGARQRILVIASVHQRLYGRSRLQGIEIGGLLRDLAASASAGSGPVPVECEIDGTCVLPVERAVALALIFDDLLRTRLAAQPEADLSPSSARWSNCRTTVCACGWKAAHPPARPGSRRPGPRAGCSRH
ncbi:histidine kinase dimerization/phosphoacceptor domain -containing protein [Pseudoroseomonas wenyumeiae]